MSELPIKLFLASLLSNTFINVTDGNITALQTKSTLAKRVNGSDKITNHQSGALAKLGTSK